MSDPDQPDRYGPEPSRKTCRDCGGFVGDRAGCSTNGCPGQEEPADHQGWGDDDPRVVAAPAADVKAPQRKRDYCTDPDNCQRCKADSWDQPKHHHAGIPLGLR